MYIHMSKYMIPDLVRVSSRYCMLHIVDMRYLESKYCLVLLANPNTPNYHTSYIHFLRAEDYLHLICIVIIVNYITVNLVCIHTS
jgi:hypothetical protein